MHSEVFETSAEGLWKMFDSPAIRDYQYPPLLSPFPIIPNIVVCLYGDAPKHAYGVCDFSLACSIGTASEGQNASNINVTLRQSTGTWTLTVTIS